MRRHGGVAGGLLVLALVLVACGRGGAIPPTTTTSTTEPPTTVATTTTTTTRPEHPAITALREYFDAYARAVQARDPDIVVPHIDPENSVLLTEIRASILRAAEAGELGDRTVVDMFVEFERTNDAGDTIASVRALYAVDAGVRNRSFGFVELGEEWYLTAISDEGFE